MRKQIKSLTDKAIVKAKPVSRLVKLQRNNQSIAILCFAGLTVFLGIIAISVVRKSNGQKHITKTVKTSPDTVIALGRIELEEKVTQLTPTPDLGNVRV